jgi:hypothetical protein
MTYEEWYAKTDTIVQSKIMVGIEDMPDLVFFRDFYEDDVPPAEMADHLLQNWVDEGDLPEGLL